MDRWDVMTGVGAVLIGVAVYLALGVAATLMYSGVALALVGVAGALARRRLAEVKDVNDRGR